MIKAQSYYVFWLIELPEHGWLNALFHCEAWTAEDAITQTRVRAIHETLDKNIPPRLIQVVPGTHENHLRAGQHPHTFYETGLAKAEGRFGNTQ